MQLTARYNMCTFKQTKKLRDIFSLFKTSEDKQQQTPQHGRSKSTFQKLSMTSVNVVTANRLDT